MPDYGRELQFGAFIPPVAAQAGDVLDETLLSHFADEERELVEPLARFGYA